MNTTKQACSKEPFSLDWSAFYALIGLDPRVNQISSSVWVITGGVSIDLESNSGGVTTALVSGGTVGETATIKNTIQVDGGTYKDCRTITLAIT